jgi:transcriptional regulator with XRE-family HTH domain
MPLNLERLRQAREEKGFTQEYLARLCGFTKTQMFRYEKGENDPTTHVLELLVRNLDVSADFLLGLTNDPKGQLGDALNADERKLLDALKNGDTRVVLEVILEWLHHLPK